MSDEAVVTPSAPADAAPQTPTTTQPEAIRGSRAERVAAATARLEAEDKQAKAAASKPADETNAETEPVTPPQADDAKADTSTADSGADKPKVEDRPAAKDPKADKLTERFAALSRKEADILKKTTEHGAAVRVFEEKVKAHDAAIAKREADLEAREARIKARDGEVDLLLEKDPRRIFDRLYELGVTPEAWQAIAGGQWAQFRERRQRDEAAKKPVDEKDRPLTRAEYEKLQKETAEKAEREAATKAAYKAFVDLTESADKDGNDRYEAASTIWSRAKRCTMADKVAQGLNAAGRAWTPEDIAEAVNTLAEQHPRWQKILAKRVSKEGATSSQSADKPSATKVADSQARQGRPGQTPPTPSPSAPAPKRETSPLNGTTPPANPRLSHKERVARMANDDG